MMKFVQGMEAPEPGDDRSPGAVLRNENGAMLIIGIFMVMFIAAMLYYVVGIGDTVAYRERMQDAADAGAMTGAIFLARGMNLITLMNLTLASIFGVLIAAQTAFFLVMLAMADASSKCNPNPLSWPHCAAALCLLFSLPEACDKIDEAQGVVSDAAAVTTSMQESVRDNTPIAATAAVAELGLQHYDPPVTIPAGAYGMGIDQLPVARDSDPPICSRTVIPWEKGGFSFWAWLATTKHSIDLAEDIGGSCGRRYFSSGKAIAPFLVMVSCAMQKSEVENELFEVEDGAELGDENFQFHTLMIGEPPYGLGDDNVHADRVSVSTWEDEPGNSGVWGTLQQLSRFSAAQGEFLFDDDKDREDWLWEMKWRARLRRFKCTDSPLLGVVCNGRIDNAFIH